MEGVGTGSPGFTLLWALKRYQSAAALLLTVVVTVGDSRGHGARLRRTVAD